ncbi:FkbM family methyltransferase [Desulfopila sp. IMCC35006]|uniref:FkbM family methyltransferase n=1 Tax=Desulfopila sp. IMCC35006 TaxID=2569542 RepID=UPI0010ABCD82|nr:FkbM family methyltransferase [Desulfopila sp. IMCC35006]TKB26461.1 FkbM family methyltransferase [Desulfopila sp. IMCC35006]
MKRAILKTINLFLGKFGAKIVSNSQDQFSMSSGLQRIIDHGIDVKSIIDIGASDGKWSMNALPCFPDAQFHAIEPLEEREEALQYLRKKHKRFDYELCVAGNTNNEQVLLNVAKDLDGSTVGGRGGSQRYVKQITIDSLVRSKKISGPFLMKFDTHGYELPILEGAKETLLSTNIIIMEVYNFKITDSSLFFYEMCGHMKRLGFQCFDIVDPMLRYYDKAFWQMDIFFYRQDCKLFDYKEYR